MKIHVLNCLSYDAGVKVTLKGKTVTVTGPRGTLVKDLTHFKLDFRIDAKARRFTAIRWFGNRKEQATINTALSVVRNMITGVTKGYRFKVRFAYAHFPINVTTEGSTIEIRNFLGEKRVRRLVCPKSVKVFRTDVAKVKDELVMEGNDLNEVSLEAAKLHQLCLVKNKDIRKFLDGIYVQTVENIDVPKE